jgi:hypothetical protein
MAFCIVLCFYLGTLVFGAMIAHCANFNISVCPLWPLMNPWFS